VRHALQFKSTTATPKLGHEPTRRQPGNDACWRTKKRTALWRAWKQKDEKRVGKEKPAVRGASSKNQDSLERNMDALLPLDKIETCTDSKNRSSKNELRTRLQTEASSVVEKKNSHGKMDQERDNAGQCSSKQKWETDQKLLPLTSKSLRSRTSSRENEQHKITMQKVIFHSTQAKFIHHGGYRSPSLI
jgi:hypothetical protein